jgi:hypothetical protein
VDSEGLLKSLKEHKVDKVKAKFGNTFVYFASLDDLIKMIKMKKAAGRPKDLEDLKYLKKLKRM